jgi:hypothetical protein
MLLEEWSPIAGNREDKTRLTDPLAFSLVVACVARQKHFMTNTKSLPRASFLDNYRNQVLQSNCLL